MALGAVAVLGLWLWLPGHLTANHVSILTKGAYGDTYGPVNALFTGLAFAVLTGTIYLQTKELQEQRRELALQREELNATRAELKGQKEQLANQSETLQLQRFENTFFELHKVHVDLTSEIEFHRHVKSMAGSLQTTVLRVTKKQMSIEDPSYSHTLTETQEDSGKSKEVFVGEILADIFPANYRLRQCLRHLFQIIRFADDASIPNQQRYVNFIEAQLNYQALLLIYYSGLAAHGKDYKPLIEKYGLLVNIGTKLHPFAEWCRDLYDQRAFEENAICE